MRNAEEGSGNLARPHPPDPREIVSEVGAAPQDCLGDALTFGRPFACPLPESACLSYLTFGSEIQLRR